jgi:hypothetical protein
VEFVIVGGVCAVYHGVPIATYDLDVCARFSEGNLRKIQAALLGLQPFHRGTPNKLPLELTPELCRGLKNLYLQTTCGKLDCLGSVAGVGDYDQVFAHSRVAAFPYGEFRILSLDALIAAKTAAGRSHDMRAVAYLEAIREKLNKTEI